jgi:hypothetical protein
MRGSQIKYGAIIVLILTFGATLPFVTFQELHAQSNIVYILTDHPSTWNFLIEPLRQAGLAVAIGNSPDLNSIDALIVFRGALLSSLSPSALLDYVSRGGGILFTAGTGSSSPEYATVNQFSLNFGIAYSSEDAIRDTNQSSYALATDGFVVGGLVIRDFTPTNITNGISQVAMWNYRGETPPGVPVMLVKRGDVVGRFSSTAYSADGTFTTASRPPAIVTVTYGRGRIVAIASDPLIGGRSIAETWGNYDNQRFIVNCAVWLSAPGLSPTSQGQNAQSQGNQPQPYANNQPDSSGLIVIAMIIAIVIAGVVFVADRRSRCACAHR